MRKFPERDAPMPSNYHNLAQNYLESSGDQTLEKPPIAAATVNVPNAPRHANPKPQLQCRLRYLKFASKDVAKTIEFYSLLGMRLDFKLLLTESNEPVLKRPADLGDSHKLKTLSAFSHPAITLAKEDYDARYNRTGIRPDNSDKPAFRLIFEHQHNSVEELTQVRSHFATYKSIGRKGTTREEEQRRLKRRSCQQQHRVSGLLRTFSGSLSKKTIGKRL